jgi:hypothetical protein
MASFLGMNRITPGLDFLARILAPLSIFPIIVAYLNSFIADQTGYSAPTGYLLLVFVLILPVIATIYVLSTRFLLRRQAAILGARMLPEPRGRLPGNFDLILSFIRALNTGYPGKLLTAVDHDVSQ